MTAPHDRTLGTLLRHLTELLDGAVERGYVRAGLDYRPRYTPVMRELMTLDQASIRTLAEHAGLTHSAASQTVARMASAGLVEIHPGQDAREHMVRLSPKARDMIPALRRQWSGTTEAAAGLDAELPVPLSIILQAAIEALERCSFDERREQIIAQQGAV